MAVRKRPRLKKPSPKKGKPFTGKRGPGGRRPHFDKEEVAHALRACGGMLQASARYLEQVTGRPCANYRTIKHYIKRYPELQDVIDEVRESTLDEAESKLVKAIRNERRGDHLRAVTYYLDRKGKERGYARAMELSGPNGGPIPGTVQLDLSGLSDKELDSLEKLYSKIQTTNGHTTEPEPTKVKEPA